MNDYDMTNEYDTLIRIFRFVRDYDAHVFTLPRVLRELVQYLRDSGYTVNEIDTSHRDYKTIQVEDHQYKLIRYPEWSTYDVRMTA